MCRDAKARSGRTCPDRLLPKSVVSSKFFGSNATPSILSQLNHCDDECQANKTGDRFRVSGVGAVMPGRYRHLIPISLRRVAPASVSFCLIVSASFFRDPFLDRLRSGFDEILGFFQAQCVTSRTTLITLILCRDSLQMTSNSVFSSAACSGLSATGCARRGCRHCRGGRLKRPNVSSIALTSARLRAALALLPGPPID